jgi:hypothetical protein
MHINKQNKHVHYEDMDFLNPYVLCLNKQKKQVQCEHMIHNIFFFFGRLTIFTIQWKCIKATKKKPKGKKKNCQSKTLNSQ